MQLVAALAKKCSPVPTGPFQEPQARGPIWRSRTCSSQIRSTQALDAVLSAPAAARLEALSGRYTIERELGHGGMATVYLAHDLRHARRDVLSAWTMPTRTSAPCATVCPRRWNRPSLRLWPRCRLIGSPPPASSLKPSPPCAPEHRVTPRAQPGRCARVVSGSQPSHQARREGEGSRVGRPS